MRFDLGPAALTALPSGALWWDDQRLLCVSDLHLGKSERMARRGGALLPPYEVAETLGRLQAEIARFDPLTVVCLGDSFDDLAAGAEMDLGLRRHILGLQAGVRWIWIEGNHDAGALQFSGDYLAEFAVDRLVFRHIAAQMLASGDCEISGHYHPKARLAGQSHPAFWHDGQRLIMPAFGTYTGGITAQAAQIGRLLGQDARALVCRAGSVLQIPLDLGKF